MANFKEQLLRTWNEWEEITGEDANNPDDFIDWAVAHGRLRPRPEDLHKIYRRQLSSVLRQAMKVDGEAPHTGLNSASQLLSKGRNEPCGSTLIRAAHLSSSRRPRSGVATQ